MDLKIKQSLIDIVRSCDNVDLSTFGTNGYPDVRTIMNALNKNTDSLNLFFITSNKSHKYEQIEKNPNVCLYYFNPETRMAIRLYGKIITHNDSITREKYWNDNWKMYGYENAYDPKYSVLEFQPKSYKFYKGAEELSDNIN